MLKHSTDRPTKPEQARIDRMMKLGCVCCVEAGYRGSERVECHHIVSTKRLGHWYTLPLCTGHHRGEWSRRQLELLPPARRVAISDGRKAFIAAFDTELNLWVIVQGALRLSAELPASKILPRRVA